MRTLIVAASLLFLLSGCSGMRLVESQVKAISTLPDGGTPLADARYRFERLPSQTDPVETDSVEAIAEAELAEVGLVHDDTAARYSVQLSSRMQPYFADNWGRPYDSGRLRGTIIIGGGNLGSLYGIGMGMGMGSGFPPSAQYRHEASLLLRDLRTGQLVYETSATHAGPWNDRYNILRALLAAALKDFPNPPAGPRSVKVEIPR